MVAEFLMREHHLVILLYLFISKRRLHHFISPNCKVINNGVKNPVLYVDLM